MTSHRRGEMIHAALEMFEKTAQVMRNRGMNDEDATKMGHYFALRLLGCDADRARREAGIPQQPIDTPIAPDSI